MTDYTIPRANAPIAGQEVPTLQWYNYLLNLGNTSTTNNSALLQDVTIISEKLGSPDGTPENIPPIGNITQIQGIDSIFANGETIVQVSLVNDSNVPGDVFYYGTSSAGIRGWQSLYSGFASTPNIDAIDTAGIVSFNLTPVTLTAGGSLMQYGFDTYGRLSESNAATTTNLAEGTNLYFTADRVYLANKADFVSGSNMTIGYNDSLQKITFSASSPAGTNYLINGFLDFWQRATSLSGSGFAADRWLAFPIGATMAVSKIAPVPGTFQGEPTNVMQVVVGAGSATTDFAQMVQLVENVRTLAGKASVFAMQVIASVNCQIALELVQYFGDGGGSRSGIGATLFNLVAGVPTIISVPVTVPALTSTATFGTAKTDYLAAVIWFDAGTYYALRTGGLGHQSATFTLATMVLAEGSTAGFSHPLLPDELSQCQRYYGKSFPQGTLPAQNAGVTGAATFPQVVGAATASTLGTVPFQQTMRTAPAVTLYNPSAANANARNITTSADWSGVATVSIGDSNFNISGTSAAGSVAGNGASIHWSADAEFSGTNLNPANFLSPDGTNFFVTDTGAFLIP
jgi:hypothetical protein